MIWLAALVISIIGGMYILLFCFVFACFIMRYALARVGTKSSIVYVGDANSVVSKQTTN